MARILVIEDDEGVRNVLTEALEVQEHAIDEAENGTAALQRAAAHRPDLVIIDWMLPGEDAPTVVTKLRRQAGRDLKVVLITATDKPEAKALALAASAVLSKPFLLMELYAVLARLLGVLPPAQARLQQRAMYLA